ncbi:MAG: hypothetical protein ACE5PM_08635 [Candidatus Hydrothermarchaeales archaeon]
MKMLIDSDSLIKLTKIGAKKVVATNIDVYMPPKVRDETITASKKEGYSDAFLIEENLNKGLLKVKESKGDQYTEEMIEQLNLAGGEADIFRVYRAHDFDAISSDDGRFLSILDELDLPYLTPSSVIVNLYYREIIDEEESKGFMERLKEIVSEEEYYLAMDSIGGKR